MQYKNLIQNLGFTPKENTSGVYQKKYDNFNDYCIEVDIEGEKINYGSLIKAESKTTINFTHSENWVVLECVDRLLNKGYAPQNITLEKTWATGHGTSGRLDILISRRDGSAYMMIECKTWGKEFEKQQKRIEKDGGQLFTYFQQEKNADVLMLYASKIEDSEITYQNLIIKIEEDYRQTGNVKDFYERWNKLPKANGIFDNWVTPYEYQSKALTKKDLKVLKQEDSSFIFNRFLEILRHNVVSDKPNAFNKIFTLFLCKIVDENRNPDDQLDFQWIEGKDGDISFQKRLTDLYRRGMKELLEKNVTDVSDSEFDKRFQQIEDKYRTEIKDIFTELRLKKNNEFAIKEVYDDESFKDNAKVVKEIVELLQFYQLRYNYRQQFLSDFFELLLTTGLKQESGQFFTPVPIARFILKSIPINDITEKKLKTGNKNDLLPLIIDYAAGSGHFVTESMEDIQRYIDKADEKDYNPTTKRALSSWKDDPFNWADDYVYAIEKDYRLVKTAKVSCYLHGDGLAKVIHGDGLDGFSTSKDYKDLLKIIDRTYPQDNKQFDLVVSNPPYSVSAFKGTLMEKGLAEKSFDLYARLTDQSSEIECLFVERTKQLLKDGGIAGIILPNSILSNSGIYTQTREIILRYFEIIAITELGNKTFMATGTNTVILFLRRRNNADWLNIEAAVNRFASDLRDVTMNGIETPVKKYVSHVWEGIGFDDYCSLIKEEPNQNIKEHEIFKEYRTKIRAKNQPEQIKAMVKMELEKLLYFILAYPQNIVLVKSGEKDAEKRFLGYEFSCRRGSEGIHPVQRSKTIDECTSLYDAEALDNPEKASTYIYQNFKSKHKIEIHPALANNVSKQALVDMINFDHTDFEKTISLAVKKKGKIYSNKWEIKRLFEVANIDWGNTNLTKAFYDEKGKYDVFSATGLDGKSNSFEHDKAAIILSAIGARCGKCFWANGKWTAIKNTIILTNKENILLKYLFESINNENYWLKSGSAQPFITLTSAREQKIILPPIEIQKKIVAKIEELEKKETENKNLIEKLKSQISTLFESDSSKYKLENLNEVCNMKAGQFVSASDIFDHYRGELYPCYGGNGLRGYTKTFTHEGQFPLIGRQGALCGNVHLVEGKFHATEHAIVAKPKQEINTKWLYYKLISLNLNQYSTGRAQPGLSVEKIKKVPVTTPSIEEQKQIVSEVEKHEIKINELQTQLKKIPQQKEMILKKYLE